MNLSEYYRYSKSFYNKNLELTQIIHIIMQISSALAYLHSKNIIHRDIKPSNILVDTAGNIKIADFGVSGNLAHTLAKCASWVGTEHYMSPERISGGSYSYDSDIWSLGITLLELAIASFPYLQTTPQVLLPMSMPNSVSM